ncbi:hypothetical protein SH1V18_04110 [Vallitalea longa]|uniref:Uncharacterized protein n=1 Tax=Vallitalea longa TaxID=2936439 RepID=A0A9W6DD14_9FIRM|nr:hypothetical protein [Vallitalea longa]GKX27931.1 hypothetical protein SH1V18_04110 [Vallitalea longa]
MEKGRTTNELIKEDKSPCEFNIDINDIPQLLKVEKLEIKKLETNINREFDNIIARTDLLENVNNKFQVENAKHNFLSETIKTEVLAEQILLDFNYQMIEIMKGLSQELESDKNECDRKYNRIKLSREAFIDYCNLHINDSRLRGMAVNGIKNKNEYKDLIEYQKNMAKTIVYTIKVAEGKEELRKYIDIIIDEFDREIENSSDEVSIRRLIEKKLSIKNLLNVVLKDKSIKIKCRKVTNDMKITKVPMSWESSNKWSGGERWSKNMTLFLGILNYLAEKKQHLNISQKNNRTVILDNPFGKASSKHVLEPVFFIAEKLGFQIIALTAHAQGKFISDYFPIVYSCRLRDAVGGERQIMTNERHINMAYLKEKSPLSVYRLQETEQLELL